MTPPSRMGMGRRLKTPRFRLMAEVSSQERGPAFLLRGLAGFLRDPDGAGNHAGRDLSFDQLFGQFQKQQRVLLVLFQGESERLPERQPIDCGLFLVKNPKR